MTNTTNSIQMTATTDSKTTKPAYETLRSSSSSVSNYLMKSYFYVRYFLVRLLTVPLPFSPLKNVPFLGHRTSLELLMIILAFYLGITAALKGFETAGVVTDYLLGITIILAFRQNILHHIFQVSFERVIFWHKIIAMVTLSTMIIHGYQRLGNISGLLIAITMITMAASYLIKLWSFNLFYLIHLTGAALLLPFGFLHYSKVYQYLLIVWFGDLLIRYFLTLKHIQAYGRLLPNDIIEIQFPNYYSTSSPPSSPSNNNNNGNGNTPSPTDIAAGSTQPQTTTRRINYQSGQFCFLMIKQINLYEFHPFSYSSSAYEDKVKLHIRPVGDWTQRLKEYIQTTAQTIQMINPESGNEVLVPLDIFHEGPYGTPAIDLENNIYDVLLLISGGIGVTPLQSLYNRCIYESSTQQRRFRKVIFIWSVKDRGMVDAMVTNKLHSNVNSSSQDTPYLPISFQPPMPPPPRQLKTTQHNLSPSRVIPMNEGTNFELEQTESEINPADLEAKSPASPSGPSGLPADLLSDFIFHNEYYMTQVRPSDSQLIEGIHPEVKKWLKFGRPDLPDIFERTAKLCQEEKISRVGVCVCGPSAMVNETIELCHSSLLNPSCQGVRFDCHSEVFDF